MASSMSQCHGACACCYCSANMCYILLVSYSMTCCVAQCAHGTCVTLSPCNVCTVGLWKLWHVVCMLHSVRWSRLIATSTMCTTSNPQHSAYTASCNSLCIKTSCLDQARARNHTHQHTSQCTVQSSCPLPTSRNNVGDDGVPLSNCHIRGVVGNWKTYQLRSTH